MSLSSTYSVCFRRLPLYRFSGSLFPFVSHGHHTSRRLESRESRPPPHTTPTTTQSHSFASDPSLKDGSPIHHPSSSPSSSSSLLSTRYPLDFIGAFQSNWLDVSHPYRVRTELLPTLCSRAYLPNFDDYMACSPYETLLEVAATRPYHDVLQLIMEHSFFFLLDDLGFVLIGAPDAPLPHVVYEDVLKVFTFASLQRPAEEQFQLSASFRFVLLAQAARICLHDAAYLYQARRLFRRMEQQQTLSAEDYALMVWIYASARDVVSCFHLLLWMTELSISTTPRESRAGGGEGAKPTPLHRWAFSPKVFSFLQHPSVDVCELLSGHTPHVVKGLLWQQRLAHAWADEPSLHATASLGSDDDRADGVGEGGESEMPPLPHPHTFAIGVHAVFLHFVLTQQVALQWRWLGMALEKEAAYWPTSASREAVDRVFSSSPSSTFMEEAAAPPLLLFGEPVTTTTPRRSTHALSSSLRGVFHVSPRTLRIAVDFFIDHQGKQCSPSAVKQLFLALVRRGDGWWRRKGFASTMHRGEEEDVMGRPEEDVSLSALLLFLLIRVRRNELLLSPASSSLLHFTTEEVEWVCVTLAQRASQPPHPSSSPSSAIRAALEDEEEEDMEDGVRGKDWQTTLALPLIRGLMTTLDGSAAAVGGGGADGSVSSSSSPRMGGWKKLLQECATFGRHVLQEKRVPEAHHHPSLLSSSLSASSPIASSPPSTSIPVRSTVAFASVQILFRSLQALDQRGLASASSPSVSGAPSSPNVSHASDPRVESSVQDPEERMEAVLVGMQRAGASASQQYFTSKVMEDEEKEEKWKRQWQEDATPFWTAL